MTGTKNPFSNLYITESIPASQFVKVFSPVLLRDTETHLIFQPGSVIVRGLQGTGKSALLNLLKPEILIEFLNSTETWPLPSHCSKFLSAYISLRSSGALDFGQRSFGGGVEANENITAMFFGDYLNYWVIDDLFNNLELLFSDKGSVLADFIGINTDLRLLDSFSMDLASNKCWFGYMDGLRTFFELRKAIKNRIYDYESFLNYNSDLPPKFISTKTSPGDPIAAAADLIKKHGILPNELPVLVAIDQFEDLIDLEKESTGNFSPIFRGVVMKMLGKRDGRVSYRVGARPYSTAFGYQGFGNSAFTEEEREYKVVDIGKVLARGENRKEIFPDFCDDVLKKRLCYEEFTHLDANASYIKHIFGPRATPEAKVKKFIKKVAHSLISAQANWPKGAEAFLYELSNDDQISARLGEAWLRQKNKVGEMKLNSIEEKPWMSKPWWKKERKQLALLQVFSANNQKMVWYGSDDVTSLSNGNIIVFLNICQFVWAEYLRSNSQISDAVPNCIEPNIQAMGIQSASERWFGKIRAEPKGGYERYAFANYLGGFFRERLKKDRAMSFPGENGFSLQVKDLADDKFVNDFLDACVAFGVLESVDHTPKSPSRGRSKKWYLASILTPNFQLPTAHIKEPFYAKLSDIYDWLDGAKISPNENYHRKQRNPNKKYANSPSQLNLDFSSEEDDDKE